MQNLKIDVKAESFPWQGKLLGILFIACAAAAAASYWWLSILLLFIGLLLLTGHSGTEFRPSDKTYREYNSYLFVRSGKIHRYGKVEKIFINASQESQRMYTAHTSESRTFTRRQYNAYLKFDNGTKIFLTSRKNKAALLKELDRVARSLDTGVIDQTSERPS